MKIHIDNDIEIFEPTQAILSFCKDKLILDNPDFYKLLRLGKYTGSTPETIALYERQGELLILPFGCLQAVWKLYPHKEDYVIALHETGCIGLEYPNDLTLFDYQKSVLLSAIEKKNGVIVMPCGSGKTCVGLAIVAEKKARALWLTHTGELLRQSKKRAESIFDLPKKALGTITEGKIDIGTHITFATVQTMCKIDLEKYRDYWDMIIVDEAQHCCGSPTRVTQFYKCLSGLSARYKIGLTATPKRADGLQRAMFALLGGIIHKVDRSAVTEKTCKVIVKTIETGYQPNMNNVLGGDGTLDYMALIDDLISNENRFKKVLETIEQLDGSAIVLANRVAYLQKLNDEYSGRSVCLSGAGYTKKAKAEREAALDKLKCGDIDIVFSTYALASEGLDCPTLKYVVLATPEKNPTLIEQSVGRVMRKAPNKEHGIAIDFVDEFPMYKKWHNLRKRVYKKLEI